MELTPANSKSRTVLVRALVLTKAALTGSVGGLEQGFGRVMMKPLRTKLGKWVEIKWAKFMHIHPLETQQQPMVL